MSREIIPKLKLTDYILGDNATRYQAFQQRSRVSDLASEIALVRAMIEKSVNAGNIAQANGLLQTLGRLVAAHETARREENEVLEKAVVLAVARQLGEMVADAIQDRFDGWEDVLDHLADSWQLTIEEAKNPEPKKR
jgi:pantothenate kinase type III